MNKIKFKMPVSGSEILALFSSFAVCLFQSRMVKRSHLIEKHIRANIRFSSTITRWSRCIIQLTAMLGYLMLVGSQKPYLYLEVPTKRFFNDLLSQHKHYCAFNVISCGVWEKKWKRVQIKMWNDVKGISKSQWPSFKNCFYVLITLLKWWEIFEHNLQNRHIIDFYKVILYFK